MLRLLTAVGLVLLVLGIAACDDDGGDDADPTPAATRAEPTRASATPSDTPSPPPDIREADLQTVPEVQNLLSQTGGALVQQDIIYADVTGDGVDEAIVPASSGGTQGALGFVVLTPGDDAPQALLSEVSEEGGIVLAVEEGALLATQAVPGPDDPECCPGFLRVTRYGWNGAALAVDSVDTIPNPALGTATPAP